jgi:hypothetical protein
VDWIDGFIRFNGIRVVTKWTSALNGVSIGFAAAFSKEIDSSDIQDPATVDSIRDARFWKKLSLGSRRNILR